MSAPESGAGARDGLVPFDRVEAAARSLDGLLVRTPLLSDPDLSEESGGEIRLKLESLQRTGSFKVRGALNFLSLLPEEELARGVVTYSSGNHGQAVAYAARIHGVRAVVVMPVTTPDIKREGARRLGAEIVFHGTTSTERRARAEAIVAREGLRIVPPFDAPEIIAGQGTTAIEVLDDWPEADTFVVPVGGGGLAGGCGIVWRHRRPASRLIGVEPEGASSMRASLERGELVTLDRIDTIADGLAPVRPGEHTFRHMRELYDDVVTVEDDAIREAAKDLLLRRKLVAEFSGSAAFAAVRSGAVSLRGRKAVVVVSGGNLDPSLLAGILR